MTNSSPPVVREAVPTSASSSMPTWSGVWLVAALELRQRARSRWWLVALVAWVLVIGAFTGLTILALGDISEAARAVFSLVATGVLGLGLLITPALSSTSINADRAAGTLATLQVTLVTPTQITVGKWMAGWLSAMVFLATALPFLVGAAVTGGAAPARVTVVVLMEAVLLAAVCAIGLGWSSVTVRTVSSVAMTYLTVAALTIGGLILFGLTAPLVTQQETVSVREYSPTAFDGSTDGAAGPEDFQCVTTERTIGVFHSERTWWMLAVNPFVVVADAAPGARQSLLTGGDEVDMFDLIQYGVRAARTGPDPTPDYCEYDAQRRDISTAVSWPYGLAANLGLGAIGLVTAVRRLRTPVRRLPRGQRIA